MKDQTKTVEEKSSTVVSMDRAKFYKKLLAAQKLVEAVKKSGRNETQKYDYARAADIAREGSRCLTEAGLAFSSTTASMETEERTVKDKNSGQEKAVFYAIAKMKYTLTDTETGYSQSAVYEGEGMDYGDKARPKAYTNSLKYFLIQTLLIPTGDDPEASDVDPGEGRVRSITDRHQAPGTERRASENQIKYISTLANKKGITEDKLTDLLIEKAGVENQKDLNVKQASEIIEVLHNKPDKERAMF